MNISSMIGSIVIGLVLAFGVFLGSSDPKIFINAHALILVFGGTIGITLVIYPFSRLVDIIDFFAFAFLVRSGKNSLKVATELIGGVQAYYRNPNDVNLESSAAHPFIKEAFALLAYSQLTFEQLQFILENRKESFRIKYQEEAKTIATIAKFPPALGLLGASAGIIEMMSGLGMGGSSSIGHAMAVALVATFWGITLANFGILPLGDYAHRVAEEDLHMREMIIEGVLMIKRGFPENVVIEQMRSRLPLKERAALTQKMGALSNARP